MYALSLRLISDEVELLQPTDEVELSFRSNVKITLFRFTVLSNRFRLIRKLAMFLVDKPKPGFKTYNLL